MPTQSCLLPKFELPTPKTLHFTVFQSLVVLPPMNADAAGFQHPVLPSAYSYISAHVLGTIEYGGMSHSYSVFMVSLNISFFPKSLCFEHSIYKIKKILENENKNNNYFPSNLFYWIFQDKLILENKVSKMFESVF